MSEEKHVRPSADGLGKPWLWPLLILSIAFLLFLFYRGFVDPDEGRYSEIPREMVSSGHWMEMRLFGVHYYEKPPLTYWISAWPIHLMGCKDWAVRLPLLPAALALAVVGLLMTLRGWGREYGITATFTAATAFGLFFAMTMPLPDSYLTLWFAATCAFLFHAFAPHASPGRRWICLLAAVFFVFLGTMTKGMIAVILPAGILFFWLLWERRLKSLWTLPTFAGALFFLALIIPTVWQIEKHNPGFTKYFFVDEHLSRFTGTRSDQVHHEPPWYFLSTLPILLIPWTFFLFRAARTMAKERVLKYDTTSRFFLVWVVIVIGFFSASTGKLMSYIMPALLPFGLLIGRWGVAPPLDGTRADHWLWRLGIFPMPIVVVLPAVLWLLGWLGFRPDDLAVPSSLSALPIFLAALLPFLVLRKRIPTFAGARALTAAFYIGMAVLVSPLVGKDMNAMIFRNSSTTFKELAAQLRANDQVVIMHRYRPSVAFYTQRIPIMYDVVNELAYGMSTEPEKFQFAKDPADLVTQMNRKGGRWYGVLVREDMGDFFESGFPTNLPIALSNSDLVIFDLSAGLHQTGP